MVRQEARNGQTERMQMRKRNRNAPVTPFPITEDDWRDARHDEDPADRRNHGELERALDTTEAGRLSGLTVLTPYQR